jgi:imidazolonepropionase-like amidohydrolase
MLATVLRVVIPGLIAAAPAAGARAEVVAFRGARIHTVSSEVIERGTILVEGGKIAAVGAVSEVAVPDDAVIRNVEGKTIVPGLVDTHSHVGIYPRPMVPAHRDGNDGTKPVQPQLRALDAIWPEDPGIRMATAGGITTANIMPGSGSVMSGQTAYVKLRGTTIDEMLIHDGVVRGGMKMANGENPKRDNTAKGKAPETRMSIAALQRDVFVRGQAYTEKWKKHEAKQAAGDESDPPERDLELEPVVQVLEGKRTVHHHTHRADDIMSVLRLQAEFGFDLVIQHGVEAYKVADSIAAQGIPVSIILLESPGGKFEVVDYRRDYGAILEAAGVKVAIHTDDFITPSRLFLRSGALAVREGMSEASALRALTQHPAEMMQLGDRVGSIDPGKDADLVVLSGPPFSVYTEVLETWIEGEIVFDRSIGEHRRYATGGFALGDAYPDAEVGE